MNFKVNQGATLKSVLNDFIKLNVGNFSDTADVWSVYMSQHGDDVVEHLDDFAVDNIMRLTRALDQLAWLCLDNLRTRRNKEDD